MEEPTIDPKYEFEAPQFVNLGNIHDEEDLYADTWFGKLKIVFNVEVGILHHRSLILLSF